MTPRQVELSSLADMQRDMTQAANELRDKHYVYMKNVPAKATGAGIGAQGRCAHFPNDVPADCTSWEECVCVCVCVWE
jgi:hypothetical protein